MIIQRFLRPRTGALDAIIMFAVEAEVVGQLAPHYRLLEEGVHTLGVLLLVFLNA